MAVHFKKTEAHLVRIGIEGDPSSYRKIPRTRLNVVNLKRVFGVDVDYLKDEFGIVVWPDDWAKECVQPPALYFVVQRPTFATEEDAAEDPTYFGMTVVAVRNVPREVKPEFLYAWLQTGLDDEDQRLQRSIQGLQKCVDRIDRNSQRIANVPYATVPGNTDEQRVAARKRLALTLQAEARELKEEKRMWETRVHEHRARRGKEQFSMKLIEPEVAEEKNVDEFFKKLSADQRAGIEAKKRVKGNTYYLKFPPNLQHFGSVLAHKGDWKNYRLAVGDHGEPVVQRVELDEQYQKTELLMSDVRVERHKHGPGVWQQDKKAGTYLGRWLEGDMHGRGIWLDRLGRYEGEFEHNQRAGKGMLAYAHGDVFEGMFGHVSAHGYTSSLKAHEYGTGTPHGLGVYKFADGAVYEGMFRNGRPHGAGRYTSPDGDIMEGTFANGVLHGPGSMASKLGVNAAGEFRYGSLFGQGMSSEVGIGKYKGNHWYGMREGRGFMEHENGARYTGHFRDDVRDGHGVMVYDRVKVTWNPALEKDDIEYHKKYEGTWRAGQIRSRNMHTDVDRKTVEYTTNSMSKLRFPWLNNLSTNESKTRTHLNRRVALQAQKDLEARRRREVHFRVTFHRELKEGDSRLREFREDHSDGSDDDNGSEGDSMASTAMRQAATVAVKRRELQEAGELTESDEEGGAGSPHQRRFSGSAGSGGSGSGGHFVESPGSGTSRGGASYPHDLDGSGSVRSGGSGGSRPSGGSGGSGGSHHSYVSGGSGGSYRSPHTARSRGSSGTKRSFLSRFSRRSSQASRFSRRSASRRGSEFSGSAGSHGSIVEEDEEEPSEEEDDDEEASDE